MIVLMTYSLIELELGFSDMVSLFWDESNNIPSQNSDNIKLKTRSNKKNNREDKIVVNKNE